MQISIRSDLNKVAKQLPRIFRAQVPFAASQALSETASQLARYDVRETMDKELDRPTPWTKSGVRYIRARKTNLTSVVYIMPNRWDYLQYVVQGGQRMPKGRAIPIQITDAGLAFMKRNRYGNIGRNAIKRATARPDTFWGEIKGIYGLWRRVGNQGRELNLLAIAVPSADYDPQFDFFKAVDSKAGVLFTKKFARKLEDAIRTARI